MSRNLTTAFKDIITSDLVPYVMLITLEFDSSTLRFWNGVGDLVYNSNTYTGSGNLIKVQAIDETQNLEARGASFELSGVSSATIALALAEEYQGRAVTLEFAVRDSNGAIIADPFPFFKGKADTMNIQSGRDTSSIMLTVENDLIALQRKNVRRKTPEDQKRTYPGDTFFDNVAALQSKEVVWGRNA